MKISRYEDRESHLFSIYQHAVAAADPAKCIQRHLSLRGETLILSDQEIQLSEDSRLILIAFGKASVSMARQAVRILGPRLSHGLVVAPTSFSGAIEGPIEVLHGNHPLPGDESLSAGRRIQQALAGLAVQDLVLVLISGGGSAMLELPKPGLHLETLQKLTDGLLRSGAPIEHVNIVRKAISQTKGGGLARMAAPAQTAGLILSDVVGNPLEAIASGPTVIEAQDPGMPRRLLTAYSLWKALPSSLREAIESSSEPSPESPPPINIIIGSNHILVEAAKEKASELGFDPQLVSLALTGEARKAATMITHKLIECPPGGCVIMGGETTVTVQGEGLGGRNQELALAAALNMDGVDQVALISAASDGVDGPTDAAGGWVDGSTVREAEALNLDIASSLEDNNSYPLLDRLGRLVKVGPTGTNVNDLVVGLKYSNGNG